MIKAVIFDFFGVICSDEYWNFVKEDKNVGDKFHQLAQEVNLGRISWRELVEKIAKETGESTEEVEKMFAAQKINPILVAYVHKLHSKYKTALLTNANKEQFEPLIQRAHIDKVFDEIVISSTLGMAKPDPRIFMHALAKLGVKANEAVFIDDMARHTESAQSLGIKTILYKNFEQMKEELEALISPVADN